VRHLDIESTSTALGLGNSAADGVIAHGTGFGCSVDNGTLTNSVCWSASAGGAGLASLISGSGTITNTVHNDDIEPLGHRDSVLTPRRLARA